VDLLLALTYEVSFRCYDGSMLTGVIAKKLIEAARPVQRSISADAATFGVDFTRYCAIRGRRISVW